MIASRASGAAAAVVALLALAGCTGCTGPDYAPPAPSGTGVAQSGGGPSSAPPARPVEAGLPTGGAVPAGFTLTSITAVAGGITYALGTAPCAAAPCTSVVRSTDGGRSWRGVPAPRAPLPANPRTSDPTAGTVRDLRFATPKDGWAYGGGLWSTHDGGARWRRVDVGGSVLDLASTGTTAYALVATCEADGSLCTGTRLLSSASTRDSFQTVAGVTLPAVAAGIVTTGAPGVVVSVSGASYLAPKGGGFRRVDPRCVDRPVAVVAAAGDAAVVAFCADAAAGSSYLSARWSADGGRSWVANPGVAGRLPNGLFTFTAATRNVLAVASASRDLRGGMLVTGNAGGAWTPARLPPSPAGWRYVGAAGASTLVALAEPAQAAYWTSSDGGRSWSRTALR